MEEAQIVVDVKTSSLSSESMQLQASPLSESSPMSEDIEASPLSESMQRKLDTLRGNMDEENNFTIFRTPHHIFKSKKKLFKPSVISIGPFHRGQKHLQALEEKKWQFLQDFMSLTNLSLDLCISEMKSLEERTRRCYSETVDLGSNAFVEMMLLDGCFVLLYFKNNYEGNFYRNLDVGWNSRFVELDLLLLENQIPFFIVGKLYEIGFQEEHRIPWIKYIAFRIIYRGLSKFMDNLDEIPDPPAEIHHLVHLCYHYLVPKPEKPVPLSSKSFDLTNRIKGLLLWFLSRLLTRRLPNSTGNISCTAIPSATELNQKGLKFTPKSNPKHMLDISFEDGVLEIPRLAITDDTKPIFTNLIAFEHSKYGKDNSPFTSFIGFLDYLVNTPNDVTILQECGIIENWLGSEEELAHFLNQVTEGTSFDDDHYLAELYMEVNRYSESTWHRQRAILIRDYFSSPWAAISLIAGLILLVLTCVQSFYAVYAYKFPPRS